MRRYSGGGREGGVGHFIWGRRSHDLRLSKKPSILLLLLLLPPSLQIKADIPPLHNRKEKDRPLRCALLLLQIHYYKNTSFYSKRKNWAHD